jgi:hypothetical protein
VQPIATTDEGGATAMVRASCEKENDCECRDPRDLSCNAYSETAALSHPSILPPEPLQRPVVERTGSRNGVSTVIGADLQQHP